MTQADISKAKDPALRVAMDALLRAGVLARQTAMVTGTDLVYVIDGKLVRIECKTHKPQTGTGRAK